MRLRKETNFPIPRIEDLSDIDESVNEDGESSCGVEIVEDNQTLAWCSEMAKVSKLAACGMIGWPRDRLMT